MNLDVPLEELRRQALRVADTFRNIPIRMACSEIGKPDPDSRAAHTAPGEFLWLGPQRAILRVLSQFLVRVLQCIINTTRALPSFC